MRRICAFHAVRLPQPAQCAGKAKASNKDTPHMTDEFTKQQIEAWRSYERVRQRGAYNMFDPRARKAARLSQEDYLFCMKHFSALKDAANAES